MKIPKTILIFFKDCEAGQLYGLEKFWAFTKYYKHADELHIQPQLKEKLEPFNCIEDFKVLYTEDDIGKRSRNPSFSNSSNLQPGYGGRRSRTASEGDNIVQTSHPGYMGRHSTSSTGGGQKNSGGATSNFVMPEKSSGVPPWANNPGAPSWILVGKAGKTAASPTFYRKKSAAGVKRASLSKIYGSGPQNWRLRKISEKTEKSRYTI